MEDYYKPAVAKSSRMLLVRDFPVVEEAYTVGLRERLALLREDVVAIVLQELEHLGVGC